MFESIMSRLFRRAEETPDERLFTVVGDDGADAQTLSVRETCRAAQSVAGFLTEVGGLVAGDRALLAYPSGLEFVAALAACLHTGIIPIPIGPPNPFQAEQDLATLARLLKDSSARAILTSNGYRQQAQTRLGDPLPGGVPWLATDACALGTPRAPARGRPGRSCHLAVHLGFDGVSQGRHDHAWQPRSATGVLPARGGVDAPRPGSSRGCPISTFSG